MSTKIKVANFWLQPTPAFPDGAPQREEYDSDFAFDFACLDYAAEWLKVYECENTTCRNPVCPQHGPAIVRSWKKSKPTP